MENLLPNLTGVGVAGLALLLGYKLAVQYITKQTVIISRLVDAINRIEAYLKNKL